MSEAPLFGALLRRKRRAAGLSQEALAELAGISADAVAALERGRRTSPRPSTVTLLAAALKLDAGQRAELLAAALGCEAPASSEQSLSSASPPALLAAVPAAPNALIGRERDLASACDLLRRADPPTRLLTLLGPGGVGKTRLALAIGAAMGGAYADGVAFVDLSAVQDARLVAGAIARALRMQESSGQDPRGLLLARLARLRMLLILDNFEQALAAGPLIADLLAGCAGLALLVTSRAALRLRAEHRFPVLPLATPAPAPIPAAGHAPDGLMAFPAVRLFVERAQAVEPGFALDAANAEAVAEICRRVDGLPLAIELAAARSDLLPPAALLARLQRRLPLLTAGAPDLPERQQTLRAAIAWSYDLLDEVGQTLFTRLGVFAGGCTLAAAEAVCAPDGAADAFTTIAGLIDQSLVQRTAGDADGNEPRIGMLETIHEYARERLEHSGEAAALRRRHAEYCLNLAQQAAAERGGPGQAPWLRRLEREHDNLRAALDWAQQGGDLELGLRLAGSLWFFWQVHGHLTEGRRRLAALLARAEGDEGGAAVPLDVRAGALFGAAVLARRQGDYAAAQGLGEQDLALRRALGDQRGIAAALTSLGNIARLHGEYARATALYEEGLAICTTLNDRWAIALTLNNLGNVSRGLGAYRQAVERYDESLAIYRELQNAWGAAGALANLAEAVRHQGDAARAVSLGEESLGLYQSLDDRGGAATALLLLGNVTCAQGDLGQARALLRQSVALFRSVDNAEGVADALAATGHLAEARGEPGQAQAVYTEALTLYRDTGNAPGIATCLEGLAALTMDRRPEQATRWFAAAAVIRRSLGAPRAPLVAGRHAKSVMALRAALGEGGFAAAWAEGEALAGATAITEALAG